MSWFLKALAEGSKTPDLLSCHLDKLVPDVFFLEFRKHRIDKNGGIAVLTGTTVECNNFHDQFL
ncbi:MAG TPA: hypothetical protein VMW77_03570 [Methanoregula sp.]|nr:hypothetical protein [Methanoregula sp.]